ncbi:MAG TPA: hypothetical protein VK437_02465, partial [Steroidobacteraceae bacterium]|nr:hypothetical protein [Steroidobacteraceae bacterium]
MAQTRSVLRRVGRALLWAVLACVTISVGAVLLLRWVNPPYSAFMAEAEIAAWTKRDQSYVSRHTWV